MENELMKPNDLPQEVKKVSKSEMIRFVHDVKELEMKALTLENMAKECYQKANTIERTVAISFEREEQNLLRKQSTLEADLEKKKKEFHIGLGMLLRKAGVCIGIGFVLGLGVSYVLLQVGFIVPEYSINTDGFLIFCPTIALLIGSVLFYLEHQKLKREIPKLERECEEKVAVIKKNLVTEAAQYEDAKCQAESLRLHAKELGEAAAKIRHQLKSIYAVNIVPPKYRNLQCLSLIDEVFENDQADTMREATLLCETRLFQNGVLQKLEELAESMNGIRFVLESMARDVSMMSQDVFRIAENSAATLSEAKSTRYAAEATARAAERVAFYEQIRYAENR